MNDKDVFFNRVVDKTNVSKDVIFRLANDLQTKDLNNDQDIREFIKNVAKITNKSLDEKKIEKLVYLIKSNKVPKDIDKMV